MKRSELTIGMTVCEPGGATVRVLSTDKWRHLRNGEKATPITIGIETYYVHGVLDPKGQSVAVQTVQGDAQERGRSIGREAHVRLPAELSTAGNLALKRYVSDSNERIRIAEAKAIIRGKVVAFWGDLAEDAIQAFGTDSESTFWHYSDRIIAVGKVHYSAVRDR